MKLMTFDFQSRRSMVTARRGMVATSNPLASQAGLAILRQGGNAADAAVASAAVLNVTEAASTGMGGDMFAMYYDAKTQKISALNGSGRCASELTLDRLQKDGHTTIPVRHGYSITVPGAVRGWEDLLKQHGTMRFHEVLADAYHYAHDGFPVHPVYAASWKASETVLKQGKYTADYLPNGKAPQAGQIVTLPALARTLAQLREGGADAFYHGQIAEAIVGAVEEASGVMTLADLQQHLSTWDEPIKADYHGVTVWECPPNGQGIVALQALRLLEAFDLASLAFDSPERIHWMVEASRLAFADARHYVADLATNPAPVEALLSQNYIAERRQMIQADRAMEPASFGMPFGGSDTVYLSVVDGEGNACSFINSLYMGFGSGVVAKEAGFFLQNRGALFSLEADAPNVLAPNKRPYHTIIPALATHGDTLYSAFGVMGGFMQPQGHVQMICAIIDDGLNPQEALNRPRWCLDSGTSSSMLLLEEGIPVATMSRLASMGHHVRPISGRERGHFGDGQIIVRDAETGVLFGGSDPRKDGLTAAY